MTKIALHIVFAVFCFVGASYAETITLDKFIADLKKAHPFFKQQELSVTIAESQRDQNLGDTDWRIAAESLYRHAERGARSTLFGSRQDAVDSILSLERKLWSTGGSFALSYSNSYLDQSSRDIQIPGFNSQELFRTLSQDFETSVGFSYIQPLLKNRAGLLDTLDYDVASFQVELEKLLVLEAQEGFISKLSQRFLDWVEITEKRKVSKRRYEIAKDLLKEIKRKKTKNIVEEVDVLRAEDELLSSEQQFTQIDALWAAIQSELAIVSDNSSLKNTKPRHALYKLLSFKDQQSALQSLRKKSRVLIQLDRQYDILTRKSRAVDSSKLPELNVVTGAGLRQGSRSFQDSHDLNQPEVSVGLRFNYPLGNTRSTKLAQQVANELQQIKFARDNTYREIAGSLANIITQLGRYQLLLEQNERQIETAEARTAEELRLYDQGRGELNFVLRSRDNVQNARFRYAENAANFQRLHIAYLAIIDSLLPAS